MKTIHKTFLTILMALTMTACTSTQSLYTPEQASVVGIEAGDDITLQMTDGQSIKGRFVKIEDDQLVYDARSGDRTSAPLNTISSLSYRAYDSEKTGDVVAGTATITGMVLLGFVEVLGAFAQGMSY